MSRSLAKSGKAIATKSLKEKWLSIVQSMREKGENAIGGSSTVTCSSCGWTVLENMAASVPWGNSEGSVKHPE